MLDSIFSRSRLILSTLVFILFTGAIAYILIPKENNPDVSVPILYVSVHMDEISPEDSEKLLVRPIEEELSGVVGVKKINASAYRGGGFVLAEFNAGYDLKKALRDVEKAVDRAKSELPSSADAPTVSEVSVNDDPVIIASISGQVSERELLAISKKLQKAYKTIPEILDVTIIGEKEEELVIILKPEVLESYNITPAQVAKVFNNSNRLITAGTQSDKNTGQFNINVPGTFTKIEDILDLPIISEGDQQVQIRDLATYSVNYKTEAVRSRMNGEKSISIEITKRSGENLLNTVAKIRFLSEQARKIIPNNVTLKLAYDSSVHIKTMLSDLENSILTAITLIMIIVVGALGLRSGFLVGISIPASFLMGIIIIYSLGLSINVVVLFGLILAVGMLVDGTIVIVEYAERKRSEGIDTEKSYTMAIRKMGFPIISSTATTLAAFVPLLFWPGVVGKFMQYIPLTLICVLASSMLVALIIIPALGIHFKRFFSITIFVLVPILMYKTFSIFGSIGSILGLIAGIPLGYILSKQFLNKQLGIVKEESSHSKLISHGQISDFYKLSGVTRVYYNILKYVLVRPFKIIIMAAIILVTSWGLYIGFGKGVIFFPDSEPSVFTINIHSPGNLSLDEKDDLVSQVEDIALAQNSLMNEFKSVQTKIGKISGRREKRTDKIGVIYIELKDWDQRRPYSVINAEIIKKMSVVKGIELRSSKPAKGPKSGKPINIEITGSNRADVEKSIKNIIATMQEMKIFTNIDSTLSTSNIDFTYIPNREKSALYGVDMQTIGQTIRLVTTGIVASKFRPDFSDDEVDIVIKYPTKYRTLSGIDELRIITPEGVVPLSEMVVRKAEKQTPTLRRKKSEPMHSVDSKLIDGVIANDALESLLKRVEEKGDIIEGTQINLTGDKESQKDSMVFLTKAFGIAIFLMAVILLLQFNSFYSTFLILIAVIMSTVGVMLGLLIAGKSFSIVMSGVGIIALAGIVVNNNIVLISTFDDLKSTEKSIYDATVRTAVSRLRPVLLTSITTGLGLLPTALGISIDFISRDVTIGAPSGIMWQLLSQNILFGLIFASVLTLIITPCALYIFYKRQEK